MYKTVCICMYVFAHTHVLLHTPIHAHTHIGVADVAADDVCTCYGCIHIYDTYTYAYIYIYVCVYV